MLHHLYVAYLIDRTVHCKTALKFLQDVNDYVRKHAGSNYQEEHQKMNFLLTTTPMGPDEKHLLFWNTMLYCFFKNIDHLLLIGANPGFGKFGDSFLVGCKNTISRINFIVLLHLMLLIAYYIIRPEALEFESNKDHWSINLKKVPLSFRRILRSINLVGTCFNFKFANYCDVTNKFCNEKFSF